jgi:ATP-dependent Zn protease
MGYAADEEIDTAYHEAGHAVLGCVVGRYPLSVTIVRVGAVPGKNEYEAGVPDFARKYLNQSREKQLYAEQRVLTGLAGTTISETCGPT